MRCVRGRIVRIGLWDGIMLTVRCGLRVGCYRGHVIRNVRSVHRGNVCGGTRCGYLHSMPRWVI